MNTISVQIMVCKVKGLSKLKTKTGINDGILPGYTFRVYKRPHLLCHILDCGKPLQLVCLLNSFEPCRRKRKPPILPDGEVSWFLSNFDGVETYR